MRRVEFLETALRADETEMREPGLANRKQGKMMKRIVIAIAIWISSAAASAETLIVPDDYSTIQQAVEAAGQGDTVLVRPGLYESDLDFTGRSLRIVSVAGPSATTIESLNDTQPVASIKLLGDESVLLEGFTVVQGRYLHPALLIRGGSVTIRDCDFPTINGVAAIDAGGAEVQLERCRIWGHQLAIRATSTRLTLRDCEISDGLGAVPPGIWTNGPYTELDRCLFRSNRVLAASYLPGATIAQSGGQLIARDCVFEFNSAQLGGAIALNCEARITRCRFSGNLAHVIGGAILAVGAADVTLRDCLFDANRAMQGGALGLQHEARVGAVNSVFVENWAQAHGALAAVADSAGLALASCTANHPDLPVASRVLDVGRDAGVGVVNSVLWGDAASEQIGGAGQAVVMFSDVRGGAPGVGNISADPLFADVELRLAAGSPCIDAGSETEAEGITQDRDGCPRVVGAGIDLGAHEWRCPGDLDGDAAVSMADVEMLLSRFGEDGRACEGDLTGDGHVDLSDLGALLVGCSGPSGQGKDE